MPLAEVTYAAPQLKRLADLGAPDVLVAQCRNCHRSSQHSPWHLHLSFTPDTPLDRLIATLRCPICAGDGARSWKILRAHYADEA